MGGTKCKYPDWTRGQVEALLNVIGEENAKEAIAGNVQIRVEKIIKTLFDKHGRRISEGLYSKVRDADRDFYLKQPILKASGSSYQMSYTKRLVQLHDCLEIDTGITVRQFREETERLAALIKDNPQITNIMKGVWLPIIMPSVRRINCASEDLGATFEHYLKGAKKSYIREFPNRKWRGNYEEKFTNEIYFVNESRYDQLIERIKKGPVPGIYFPTALRGLSINAAREQMAGLPQGFILAGLSTVVGMIMYPDILARDTMTPGLGIASLFWRPNCNPAGRDYMFYFKTFHDELVLGNHSETNDGLDCSGLLFIG